MARDVYGYPTEPRNIDPELWFYEQREGLVVVQELRKGKEYLGTATATVPWRRVCAAVDRHRKIRAKRR